MENLLVQHCAPALAGIKTGNLFSCSCPCQDDLTKEIRQLNRKLVPKGVRILPLRVCCGRALIYVYRPTALQDDLKNRCAQELLIQYGYMPENANSCVIHLMQRLQKEREFPHEIGLFLSYPPEDVKGFISNRACNPKCTGCWKVYGDEQAAKHTFERYTVCSRIYFQKWKQGAAIESLTIAS